MTFCDNNNIHIVLNKYMLSYMNSECMEKLSFTGIYEKNDVIDNEIFLSLKFKDSNIIPCYLRSFRPFKKEDDFINFMRDFSIRLYEFLINDNEVYTNKKITKEFNTFLIDSDKRYSNILNHNQIYWIPTEKNNDLLQSIMITNKDKILFSFLIE